MAVHNEHSRPINSFPSFHETEHFDEDDDGDNNFIISLNDSEDEDEQKPNNMSPVCASVNPIQHKMRNNFLNQETSTHKDVPYSLGINKIYDNSDTVFPSSVANRDPPTYQQFLESTVKNNLNKLQPILYSTSKENQDITPGLYYGPVSNSESGVNCQDGIAVTVSCSSGSTGTRTTFSVRCAADPYKSLSESQNRLQGTQMNTASQMLPKPSSELSEMNLETISLSKETGGMWSEAVFLSTVGMSDGSFSDISSDPNDSIERNSIIHKTLPFMTKNVSPSSYSFPSASCRSVYCTPKLSGPYPQHRPQEIEIPKINPAVQNGFQKIQPIDENTPCTCIMCYKGIGIVDLCSESESEDPKLTEEEEDVIFSKQRKRKKIQHSTIDITEKASVVGPCSTGVKDQLSTLSKSRLMLTQTLLNNVGHVSDCTPATTTLHATHPRSILNSHGLTFQSKPDVSAHNTLVIDMYNRGTSINPGSHEIISSGVSEGTKQSQCEKSLTTTNLSNVKAMILQSPNKSQIVNVSRFRFNPTKVFLKPSQVPGLKSQIVLPAPELSSNNTPVMSSNDRECLLPQTAVCKESPQTPASSSTTFSSPPSYKIIYVSADQVLVCPSQTSTSVDLASGTKQTQISSHRMTVKLPQSSTHSTILSPGSIVKTLPNVVTQNSQFCASRTNGGSPFSQHYVSTLDKHNELRHVLKNAEKIDISRPGKVLIQLKSSPPKHHQTQGDVQTLATTTNATTPVSKSSVHMISLLKGLKSPQVQNVRPAVGLNVLHGGSATSNTGHSNTVVNSPVVLKPSNLEVTKTLMYLINSHFQEKAPTCSENALVKIIKEGLKISQSNNLSHTNSQPLNTSQSNLLSHANSQPLNTSQSNHPSQSSLLNTSLQKLNTIDSAISGKLHHIPCSLTDNNQTQSPDKDNPEKADCYISPGALSKPCLPQEGLPSTYVADWVNKAKSYASEHRNEGDYFESLNMNPSFSNRTATSQCDAFISSSTDDPKGHVHRPQINNALSSSVPESPNEELTLPMLETQNKQLSSKPTFSQTHMLQDHPTTHISSDCSSTNFSNCHISTLKQLDQSSTSQMTGKQNTAQQLDQSSISQMVGEHLPLNKTSNADVTLSNKSLRAEAIGKNCTESMHCQSQSCSQLPLSSDMSKNQFFKSAFSASSIINSSEGIKLKIKLSDLKLKTKYDHTFTSLESRLQHGDNKTPFLSTDGLLLQKRMNVSDQEDIIDECEKEIVTPADGSKIETAEEMFQRFQKQAEQEVIKAQMGMGYLSRSLRPARNNFPFIDKYQYRLDSGKLKKKIPSEGKNEFKKAEENHHISVSEIDQQTGKHSMQNKSNMRNKRQTEEAGSKEIRVKHPKLSMKDYPNLKEDCSIVNSKKIFCSNILAGHKVYVKFNTYENINTGRSFLVPFFNIGGSRTQFDVEDMEYINQAVVEFEKEERSCARHLLFYAREGQKATFLRKETHFQANQDRNYTRCSFILEGFRRDARKEPEPSSEHWKVDNTVDIEIDTAEIDNDAEMEFNANTSYDDGVSGLGNCADDVEKIQTGQEVKDFEQEIINRNDPESIIFNKLNPLSSLDNSSTNIGGTLNRIVHRNQSVTLKSSSDVGMVSMEDSEAVNTTEKECISKHVMATVSAIPNVNDSVQHSNKSSAYTERLEQILSKCQYTNTDVNQTVGVQQKHPVTCTVVKTEYMDVDNLQCMFESSPLSTVVKQEEPDYGYEDNTDHQYRVHAADTICSSKHLSPIRQQTFDKNHINVKKEPLDEYFDWSVDAQHCSSKGNETESVPKILTEASQHAGRVLDSPTTHLCQTTAVQPRFVRTPSKKVSSTTSIADVAPSCCVSISQDLITESVTLKSPSLLQAPDNVALQTSDVRDLENHTLEPFPTNMNSDKETCDLMERAESIKTASEIEPSLPESPLPSSSVSESSEISASSDIDVKLISPESDSSVVSETCLSTPELEKEEGNIGNKQNSIQSKITSLVESLRHRLTQETSSLPIWLADTNASTINTTFKKRKKSKRNPNKKHSKNKILSPERQMVDDIANSNVDLPMSHASNNLPETMTPSLVSSQNTSSLDKVQSLSSPPVVPVALLSALPTDSASVATICTQFLPADNLQVRDVGSPLQQTLNAEMTLDDESVCSRSTSFKTIMSVNETVPNKSQMMLPIKWPKENHHPMVNHAASIQNYLAHNVLSPTECIPQEIDKKMSSSENVNQSLHHDFIDENDTGKNEMFSDEECCMSYPDFGNKHVNKCNNSNNLHKTAFTDAEYLPPLPGDLNTNRQSPVDLEIEVGNEDLPETALRLQSILPYTATTLPESMDEGQYQFQHLQPTNQTNMKRPPSASSRLRTNKIKQYRIDEQWIDTRPHDKNPENPAESAGQDTGSVTNYLYQKFLFSSTDNKIKGPRLLHMPGNRQKGVKELNNPKTVKQNTAKVNNITCELITATQLSTAPSVVEIFGASTAKVMETSKIDCVELGSAHVTVNNNNGSKCEEQMLVTSPYQVPVSKKRVYKRTGRKKTSSSNIRKFKSSKVELEKPVSAVEKPKPLSSQHQLLNPVEETHQASESISNVRPPVCKIILTKLENMNISGYEKVSEYVFVVKKNDTGIKLEHETDGTNTHNNSSPQICNSQATLTKVVKKKRKKALKVAKKPIVRPKRDIVDYYTIMLENLQRKAQQLEEESRRKAEEDSKKKSEGKEGQAVNEQQRSSSENSKTEEMKNICEDLKEKTNEAMKGDILQEVCNMEVQIDCLLQTEVGSKFVVPSTCNETTMDTLVTANDTVEQTSSSGNVMNSESSCEKLKHVKDDGVDRADNAKSPTCGVGLAENAESPKEKCHFVVCSEANDVTDSNWPFLQKFCDETIFNQGSTDYLQKVSDEVCFPNMSTVGGSQLKFDKKDIVLGGSVHDETLQTGRLITSGTLVGTEDIDCLQECSDEHETDHMEEDEEEMLLSLDIQKTSAFSHEDQETSRNPFSLAVNPDIKHTNSLLDNGDIADGIKSGQASLSEVMNISAENNKDNLSSLLGDASHSDDQRKSTDDVCPSKETPRSSTTAAQPLTHKAVSLRNAEVSPSWERLLGHKSFNISQTPSDSSLSSDSENVTNQNVSFVAGSDFKFKFKLPKGILSKAVKMSRDMKHVFDGTSLENSSPGKQELSAKNSDHSQEKSVISQAWSVNSSVEQPLENTIISKTRSANSSVDQPLDRSLMSQTRPTNNSIDQLENNKEYIQNSESASRFHDDLSVVTTQTPVPGVKLSSLTLTAIQKAKSDFLQRRKRGRKSKQRQTVEKCQSRNVPDHPLLNADIPSQPPDRDQSFMMHQESSADPGQKLQHENISVSELPNLFSGSLNCHLKGEIEPGYNTDSKPACEERICPGSVLQSIGNTADNEMYDVVLKQNRKEGIFSNIDIFQGFDHSNSIKQASEPPSEKDAEANQILKTNVIDISKLKLKLKPLILSKLKKLVDVDIQPTQESSKCVLGVLPEVGNVQDDLMPQGYSDLKMKSQNCELAAGLNDSNASSSLEPRTKTSNPQNFIPTTDHNSVTSKSIPQVNAAKLCNIFKNFHKTAHISSQTTTNHASKLLDISEFMNTEKTTQDSSNYLPEKSNQLSSSESTFEIQKDIKGRKTRKRTRSGRLTQSNKAKVGRKTKEEMESVNQNILTDNSENVTVPIVGHEENFGEGETMKNEEKGNRSFIDCLTSLPLEPWEEK